jgi:hypothetical protein
MDAVAEVCNEETGLLRVSSVLTACSLVARLAATIPRPSPSVAPPAAHGASPNLHCGHCNWDGHVEAFCYRKKKAQKAQAHRSSQGTGGSNSGGSKRSSTGSETQEMLMLLHLLAAFTSSGVVGSVT